MNATSTNHALAAKTTTPAPDVARLTRGACSTLLYRHQRQLLQPLLQGRRSVQRTTQGVASTMISQIMAAEMGACVQGTNSFEE